MNPDDSTIANIIQRQYQLLMWSTKRLKKTEIDNDYNENLKRIAQYQQSNAANASKWQTGWHLDLPEGNTKRAAVRSSYKVSTHTVPQFSLAPMSPLPKMINWESIRRNVIREDEYVLHHIPYINEEAVDDEQWYSELLSAYDDQVHRPAVDGFTDALLGQLVDLVTSKPWPSRSGQPIHIDKKCAFKHISTLYTYRITPNEVEEKYNTYQLFKTGQLFKETVANIDGGQLDVVASRTDALDTFQRLFCRQCFIYDCGAHADQPPTYKPLKEDYSFKAVCSSSCFLNIDTVNKNEYLVDLSNVMDIDYPSLPLASIKTDHWTNSEKTMINVLLRTYQGNFCAIARVLGSKSCAEIYVLYQTSFSEEEKAAIKKQIKNDRSSMVLNARKIKTIGRASSFVKAHNANVEKQHKHKPCFHPGEQCSGVLGDRCSCLHGSTFCERLCSCSLNCRNRFPGCKCKGNCSTSLCPCRLAGRECDPDHCKTCGADQLDLSERRPQYKCTNVPLQCGLKKHLLLGKSELTGWGVFLNENAKKGELISEYHGEIISHNEADRRGIVNDRFELSYIFTLNSDEVIDSKRMGNKIRFANHDAKNPNCFAKVKIVNGEHRIGIYASTDITKGEELFFDYGKKHFVGKFKCLERDMRVKEEEEEEDD